VFRGKEHQHNTEIQRRIYESLDWKPPITVNFGMIHLPGEKLHTRDIKEWIKSGKVTGWDDPRLHTVQALVRRGFQPAAFRLYAKQVGLTKSDIKMSWENLEAFNRSILDPISNRYMGVIDPVKLTIKNAPDADEVEADLHPDDPKRGRKKMPADPGEIYLSSEDLKSSKNKTVRLKNLYNITISSKTARFAGDGITQSMKKIQWASVPNIPITLLMPDREICGLGEPSLAKLKKGDIIQLERIGFVKVDKAGKKIRLMWTHR